MKMTIGLIIISFVSLLTGSYCQELNVHLKTGKLASGPLGAGMSWYAPWHTPANSKRGSCTTQGVLKLTFNQADRVRAEIELILKNVTGFSFNVGDSSSNDGWGGDGSSQSNDAEVHSTETTLLFYGRDVARGQSAGRLFEASGMLVTGNLTLTVQDGLAAARNNKFYAYVSTSTMFALNSQADWEGPVNNDVYFAFNRVPAGNYRSGTGVCGFRVKFYSTRL